MLLSCCYFYANGTVCAKAEQLEMANCYMFGLCNPMSSFLRALIHILNLPLPKCPTDN